GPKCLVIRGRLHVIVSATQQLVNVMVNALPDEAHRAIRQAEIGATGMVRLESPAHIPVLVHVDGVGRIAPVPDTTVVVDGYDGRAVRHAAVGAVPLVGSKMVMLVGKGFSNKDRVGQS